MTSVPAAFIAPPSTVSFSAQRVEITLSDGRRIWVTGVTVLSAVLATIAGLAQ